MDEDLLKAQLEDAFDLRIRAMSPVRGGDIAASYLLEAQEGRYFAKYLENPDALGMVKAEAEGLRAIGKTDTLRVPAVFGHASLPSGACLLMEYIPAAQGGRGSFETLGQGLAEMHFITTPKFGWPDPNFIGSLPQENTPNPDWAIFYVECRLVPQYRMAVSKGLMSQQEIPDAELMTSRIRALLPDMRPALLHGDLWGGNFLIDTNDVPFLIDPSVYYGHSEVDLAMSLLFGGFPSAFYDAYFEVTPKQPGFEKRVRLYQLYYLLVHLNLFGRSSYPRVRDISSSFFR